MQGTQVTAERSYRTLKWVLNVLIVLALVAAVLLPPISLLERVRYRGYVDISPTRGDVRAPDGTQVTFPDASLTGPLRAKLEVISLEDFLAGNTETTFQEAVQATELLGIVPKSSLYQLRLEGSLPRGVYIVIPLAADAQPYETLDLYTWDAQAQEWVWLPSQVVPQDNTLEAVLEEIPTNFIVMQTLPVPRTASVDLPEGLLMPNENADAVVEVHPLGIYLGNEGYLEGSITVPPPGSGVPYQIVPTIRNYRDGVVRTDLIWNTLVDNRWRENNIASIVDLVVTNGYAGVDIDYRGVDPLLRADFTRFVEELARRLHEQGKILSVHVEPPRQVAEGVWLTGGYDWRAIGRAADVVRVHAPVNPEAYRPGGLFEQMMRWAVGEINRRKLEVVLPARSVEIAGNYLFLKSYSEALAPIAAQLVGEGGVVQPGQEITLNLTTARAVSPLQFDEELFQYWYKYLDDQGNERVVWIENAASLARKLELLDPFNIAGVTVQHLLSGDADPAIWDVLRAYQQDTVLSLSPANYAVSWVVVDAAGNVLTRGEAPIGGQEIAIRAPEGGEIRVQAALTHGETVIGKPNEVRFAVATPTPTPTPQPTMTPTPTPTPTPRVVLARISRTINVREGPSTNYRVLTQARAGDEFTVVGKNREGTWWQIRLSDGSLGWVLGRLVSVVGPVETIQVARNIPPEPTPQPRPLARRNLPGFFDYGIQAHMIDAGDVGFILDKVKELRFNWVKQQIEWFRFEPVKGQINWGPMDQIVNAANAKGVKVLFSIVKAPRWARPPNTDFNVEGPPANPQDYADFVRAVASRYCGSSLQAIEVWNEQNLHYEWGNEPIDPARYMQLLKAAYTAIKQVCPSMIVVSGALTPTGAPPPLAMDDFQYLEAMYQNGLRQYSDAIGAHPSGYNVPPDATGCHPNVQVFRGPCDTPHHSWSFRQTMEGYRQIMVKYGDSAKRIWPTEFGWASNPNPVKGYEYAADNTLEEQAQFTVRAYQMMKQWGWVGVAFLWNLNFKVVAPGSEKAQWGIVDQNWNPLPAFIALKTCREQGTC